MPQDLKSLDQLIKSEREKNSKELLCKLDAYQAKIRLLDILKETPGAVEKYLKQNFPEGANTVNIGKDVDQLKSNIEHFYNSQSSKCSER